MPVHITLQPIWMLDIWSDAQSTVLQNSAPKYCGSMPQCKAPSNTPVGPSSNPSWLPWVGNACGPTNWSSCGSKGPLTGVQLS